MSDQEIINELVEIYRELNMQLRGQDLIAIKDSKADNGETLEQILKRMRDREYLGSQVIKLMSLGTQQAGRVELQDASVLDELVATGVTPIIMLSQYGTAREATLSLVRTMSEEAWDQEHDTPEGRMSIREYCRTLINADREDQKLLNQLVEKAPA